MRGIRKWIMAVAITAGMSVSADVVTQSFTAAEGFTSANLNGQMGWVATKCTNDATAGSVTPIGIGAKAIYTYPIVLPALGSITLRTSFHFLGTPVTPTTNQILGYVGFADSTNLAVATTDVQQVLFKFNPTGGFLLVGDNNVGTMVTTNIADYGSDNLAIEYTLTLGTLATNSTYSAKLISLTDGTETALGTRTGIDGPVFAAATTTGIFSHFQTYTSFGTTGITGLSVDEVTVIGAASVPTYNLTVNRGSGSALLTNGASATITATPYAWETFAQWAGDVAYVDNVNSSTAAVTMPATNVTLTATYTITPGWNYLKINSGTGDGWYNTGSAAAIAAIAPAPWETFARWTGDTQYVDNVTLSNATVTMPNSAVTLTASYANSGASVVTQSFTAAEGFTTAALNGQMGWTATTWINDASAGSVSASNNNAKAVYTSPIILTNGGSITLLTEFHLLGTPVTPATNQNIFNVGFNDTPSTTPTAVERVALRMTSAGKFDLRTDTNVGGYGGSTNTVNISDYGTDNLAIQYTLVIGTLATNSTVSAKLISLTAGTETSLGTITGIYETVFSAATTTGIYSYFGTMSFSNTTVTGVSVDQVTVISSVPAYPLTITGGTPSGSYTNGAVVAIAADAPAPGLTFDVWTGDTQYVASVSSSNTTVTMPAQAVALTATYKSAEVTLTASAGPNGTVTPASTNVVPGNSADFAVTASNYYRIVTLTTNGTAVTGVTFDNSSTSYNFIWSNVQAAGTVAATFTAQLATDPAGTPYSWLAGYGLTNYNTDAVADQDADGLKAWQEYIAGTDPTNKASCLKLSQTNRNTVTWSPVAGRLYSVYWSTNLVKGFTNLASGITYPQGSYTNTTPDAKVNHYQVRVQLQ